MNSFFRFPQVEFQSYQINSDHLQRQVRLDIYILSSWKHRRLWWSYPCLLFNDGQDLLRMDFRSRATDEFIKGQIQPCVMVGIHAGDRLQEYGTIGRPDYQGRGSRADQYGQFIVSELFPFLRQRFRISRRKGAHSFAGFSLGGLSAFDLGWNYPQLFGQVGVFSGSLWWRSAAFRKEAPDADLIVPNYVAASAKAPTIRCWFQAGTLDETSDRNGNGVIDAIDDTHILIRALQEKGISDIQYCEVENGTHDPETWGRVMPEFLRWLV